MLHTQIYFRGECLGNRLEIAHTVDIGCHGASVVSRSFWGPNEHLLPLILGVHARFQMASHGGYDGARFENDLQQYKLGRGQEDNWLSFEMFPTTALGFFNFEFRLTAVHVEAIFASLKKDIVNYIRDVETERPLLADLRREMERLSN